MSKITVDLTTQQITQAIDQLSSQDKMKLADKLNEFAAKSRVREILKRIDSRRGLRPSTKDILKEIHAYRKENNA